MARSWLLVSLAVLGLAHTAWAKTPYSDQEMRSVESEDERKVRDIRDQEIIEIRKVLGHRQPANRRADLYFRLAEVDLEAYHAEFLLEGRVHEKRIEKGLEDKLIDRSHSMPFLTAGIKSCQEILDSGIQYSKMDHIYYFLAFNNGELGNRQESIKYFDLLARQYPDSPFVSEAFKELGDASFEVKQFDKARQYYELALRKSPPDITPRVLHKLAWTFYRLKQYDRAVDTMKKAVDQAQASGEKFVNLKEEALRDMAVFMTESGRVDEALSYFKDKSGDKTFYPKVLERLGAQYERTVQPDKAAQVYESLLKTNPSSEEAFRVTVKLVDLDLRRNRYNEALKRIQEVQIPAQREQQTEIAAQNLKAMTRRTATENHDLYRKTKNKAALQVAESYYTVYLTNFLAKEDPRQETPEIEMYLAEVKTGLGKSQEASELYRKVLESKDKRYAKDAGALWTAALSDAIKRNAQSGTVGQKGEPSALEREFVAAADRMQEAIGETPEAREASLRAAQVLAGYSSTRKESIERIQKIITRWPKSAQAQTAARLWIQLQSDQITASSKSSASDQAEALKGMQDTIAAIRANPDLMAGDAESGQGKLKLLLADQATKMRIGTITKAEAEKDFAGAGKGYESFGVEAKDRDTAEKAYSSAVASYLKAGDAESADRLLAAWLKRYPKSPKAIDLARSASTQFLIEGKFDAAGSLFERLGREAGDAASLDTAARIFDGAGDPVRAQRDWSGYLSSYPKSDDRYKIALTLARSYEAAKMDPDAIKYYKTCMNGGPELHAECGSRLADLYFREKNTSAAKHALTQVAAARGPSAVKKKPKNNSKDEGPASSPYVGYARYRLAEMLEKEAHFDPISLPEAKLKRGIKQRVDFLEPLARAYNLAVDAGGPWAIAALDRLANYAFRFADDIDGITLPPEVDAASAAKFRGQLKGTSDPLRKRAVETWSQAYSKAVSAEVLAPAIPEIADRLADLKTSHPSRAQGFRGRLRLAGVPADSGADAMKQARQKLLKSSQDSDAWVDYGNLLWGEGKPGLARLAYERALSLKARNSAALNNRATILISSESEEDWIAAAEALSLYKDAGRQDELFIPARYNRGALLNYYRVFAKAKPIWDQIIVRSPSTDCFDGLATAEQGLGSPGQADQDFKKGTDAGGSKSRFAAAYHEAARKSFATGGGEACLDRLHDVEQAGLHGFEKSAFDHLLGACTRWNTKGAK
jgi:tetratricopeptide (TPR) repeat protein